jgi:hypothetical protein
MKKTVLALVLAAFVAPMAFADDSADKAENTVDTSKNPITGTVTTTKKSKRSAKRGKSHAKLDVTEKTKEKKNGEVEHSVDVDSDSANHK